MESPNIDKETQKLSGVIGLVLAGGKSSRMGADKSLLVFNQHPLVEHSQGLLKQTGLNSVLISSNTLENALPDKIIDCGPLSAIHSLANEEGVKDVSGMLVLPVDMPLLSVSLLNELCFQGKRFNSACFYVGNPLPAYIPINAKLAEILEQQLKSRDFSIKTLLKKLKAVSLAVPKLDKDLTELSPFFNLNTQIDWEMLIKKVDHAMST